LTFAFGNERIIKEFGIGLATAVAVDATLIRMILVPALMQLWGKANWWLPKRLERWLPKIKI
ncbi:MAG: MMPL family transporter, partial [Actinobacteria bacterium]|nr:MMPL family transporter [Actinomycetota bacterium]